MTPSRLTRFWETLLGFALMAVIVLAAIGVVAVIQSFTGGCS